VAGALPFVVRPRVAFISIYCTHLCHIYKGVLYCAKSQGAGSFIEVQITRLAGHNCIQKGPKDSVSLTV